MAVTSPCLWLASPQSHVLRDRLHNVIHAEFANEGWKRGEERYKKQIAANLDLVESDGDAAELLSDPALSGRPIIVVGAGPSLDMLCEQLSDRAAKGARIVAVDAALRPLLRHGVQPDVVVTIDPKREGVLPNFELDLSSLSQTTLVYFPIVHRDVILAWPHRRLAAYSESESVYDQIKSDCQRLELFTNGSVIHPAIDLAVKMTASEVYLAGVDLAYINDCSHAQDVPHGEELAESQQVQPLTVVNGYGEQVVTKMNLLGYLRDLEYYIEAHSQVRFVNLSRAGAYIAGTEYE